MSRYFNARFIAVPGVPSWNAGVGLLDDAEFHRFLADIEATARACGVLVQGWPKPSGPRKDAVRHEFVGSVVEIFEALAELPAGISRPADGTERGGRAARFLAGLCSVLLERLPAHIWEADPNLRRDLSAGAKEAWAGQWVEEALDYRKRARKRWLSVISGSSDDHL